MYKISVSMYLRGSFTSFRVVRDLVKYVHPLPNNMKFQMAKSTRPSGNIGQISSTERPSIGCLRMFSPPIVAPIHGHDIDNDSNQTYPEVIVCQLGRPKLGIVQFWEKQIQHAECKESIPSECSGVHVSDRPIGVVREGVHTLDGHQWTF